MPAYRQADWYEFPRFYDILLEPDSAREGDFLEAVHERHGRSRGREVLEPACGSGRLLVELARRGWRVTGIDLSPAMVAFARERLARERLHGRLVEAPMQDFALPQRFDLAHCLINTFKHLLDERSAVASLRCVARALQPGGIFVLGMHLSDYDWRSRQRERWVGRRAATKVTCNLQSWPANRRTRLERVRSRLVIEERGTTDRLETSWDFRTYDSAQLARLLRAVPELELAATYGFEYDLERPAAADDLGRVLVLRRRSGEREEKPSQGIGKLRTSPRKLRRRTG
jgi:SAM-dependent methyltransferase